MMTQVEFNDDLASAFEFVDIVNVEPRGYRNCVDISVDGDHTFLLANGIVSHNSALGGLLPVLGREDVGYYTLKGKPLNAYSQSQKKFTENKELSGLYQVLTNGVNTKESPEGDWVLVKPLNKVVNTNDEFVLSGKWCCVQDVNPDDIEPVDVPTTQQMKQYVQSRKDTKPSIRRKTHVSGGFEHIVFATDQDLDGIHIRGLLTGFIERYLPALKERTGMLQTPVIAVTKNGKVQSWVYDLNSSVQVKKGQQVDYKKGLGSWDAEDLKYIISKDGLDKMISNVDFNTVKMIDDWLGDDSAPRKEYIVSNEFSIAMA